VIGAFSDYADDAQIMHGVAQRLETDPESAVQVACINTLATITRSNDGTLTRQVYEKHIQHPNPEVREAIARNIGWQREAQAQWVFTAAQHLAQDQSEDVRDAIAFEFINMYKFPQLRPIAQHMAESDPSERVRNDALRGMSRLASPDEIVPYYHQILSRDPNQKILWSVIDGLRHHKRAPAAQQLLTQLGQHPDPNIANSARDALT
jgi:HEAT repeat protein